MLLAVTGIRILVADQAPQQGKTPVDLSGEQDHIPVVDILRWDSAQKIPVRAILRNSDPLVGLVLSANGSKPGNCAWLASGTPSPVGKIFQAKRRKAKVMV